MPRSSGRARRQDRPAASWVVVVSADGADKGMVGPFPSVEEADAWAESVVPCDVCFAWRVEPVVSPESLAQAARGRCSRPHLRIVR